MRSAASAPASSAPRVSRIASAVELDPVPATTGTRPRATRTTSRTTATCSSCVSVAASPVEPHGTRPWMPPAICASTSAASARVSTSPARNGVTRAVRAPLNIAYTSSIPSYLHLALEDLDRVAGHEHAVVGPPVDLELAAGQDDCDLPPAPPRARRGDGGGARAGSACHRLARAALPHAHGEAGRPEHADELRVHSPRKERVVLEARSQVGERERRRILVHEHDAMRIPHRHAGDAPGAAGYLERPLDHLAVGGDGDRAAVPDRDAHVDGHSLDAPIYDLGMEELDAGVGLDAERIGVDEPVVVDELREAADAVPAHLGPRAVGVVDHHPAVGVTRARPLDQDEPVGPDPAPSVAEPRRQPGRVTREPLAGVDVDEVVRRPVQLGEAERGHEGAAQLYNRSDPGSIASTPRTWERGRLQSGAPRWFCARMFLTLAEALAVRERFGTPCFVYDRATLEAAARDALAFPNAFGLTVRDAMKANSCRAVLRLFRDLGLHIDASSDPEVERALRAGFAPGQIQLTSQVPSPRLEEFVGRGVPFNACS